MREVYESVEPYRSLGNRGFEEPEALVVRRAVCNDSDKIATRFWSRSARGAFHRWRSPAEHVPSTWAVPRAGPRRIQRF